MLNVSIMAYDYAGYGKSAGGPTTEENIYMDIEAAYDHLLTERNLLPENIVLYGRSLGSGPTLYLAEKTAKEGRSIAGVILQSPILSVYRVAFNFRFTMVGDRFPNIDRIANVEAPTLIIHGTADEVVPFWHGQELYNMLDIGWRVKPFWIKGAGHNNIELLLREKGHFVKRIEHYLDDFVPARRGRAERSAKIQGEREYDYPRDTTSGEQIRENMIQVDVR